MANEKSSVDSRNSLIAFLVSLFAGAASIYVGALLVLDTADFMTATIVALIGAAAWTITGMIIGWVPLIGSIVTLIVWLGVINWFYPGGWIEAGQIAILAWIVSLGIVYAISAILKQDPKALGVPGN